MKRFAIIILVLIAIFFILQQIKLSYEHFTVDNVTKGVTFIHEKILDGNYTSVRMRVKGEIKGGSAVLKLYPCGNKITNTNPVIIQTISGKIDTVWSNDYYFKQICIDYKPKEVISGKINISVSIR